VKKSSRKGNNEGRPAKFGREKQKISSGGSGKVIKYSKCGRDHPSKQCTAYRSFSSDVTAAILVYQNNEMAAILVYGTGISSFLFTYFVLFHHPTGATDHVSENDL
jgi:hypothetical protein